MTNWDPDFRRRLARLSVQEWPAADTRQLGGWLLRFDRGVTSRANSVLPLGPPSPANLKAAVAKVEDAYRARGLTPTFQVYQGAHPAGLDAFLASQGYRAVKVSAFLVADPRAVRDAVQIPRESDMSLHDEPTDDWAAALWGDTANSAAAVRRAIFARVAPPSTFVEARQDNRVVAVGQSAAAVGWGWFHGIHTDPTMRGRRLAGAVLARLAEWAMDSGAKRLFIQVQKDNGTALRAYEASGFEPAFDYWYRVKT